MLIYLASPYTHSDPTVEDQRFEQICQIAGDLILKGYHIFCPIAAAHTISRAKNITGRWEFWQEFDRKMLDACDELWVVDMPGWQESVGINGEIRYMIKLGKPVHVVDHLTLEKRRFGTLMKS